MINKKAFILTDKLLHVWMYDNNVYLDLSGVNHAWSRVFESNEEAVMFYDKIKHSVEIGHKIITLEGEPD
jgi:hypothetical protein